MLVKLIDKEIDLTFSDDGALAWPTEWTQYVREHGFLDAAAEILVRMPHCALSTPWIIGSANMTLFGKLRTESESHMRGLAFDMSPMYSRDEILNPAKTIMGLAWNVVSLTLIYKAFSGYPHFVVEGDHLHVQPDSIFNSQVMPAVFTMPSWYPWTDQIRSDEEATSLDGSFWAFNGARGALTLMSRDDIASVIKALKV